MLTLRLSTIYIGSRRALPKPALQQDGDRIALVNPRRRPGSGGKPRGQACERCGGACFVGSGADPLPCEACDGEGRRR